MYVFMYAEVYASSTFPILHHICPPPPQILYNLCLSFPLSITAVPREIENNAYAKFGEQIRCIMGNVEVAYCAKRSERKPVASSYLLRTSFIFSTSRSDTRVYNTRIVLVC